MKLWAGRFQKETNDVVNDFNSSIQFDGRLYREDITGSIAHATMLGTLESVLDSYLPLCCNDPPHLTDEDVAARRQGVCSGPK